MSDQDQSGAPTAATGANASAPAAFGSFGATRGSGLARGKRPAPATAPAASAAASGYKPSSLEVITPKSEYVNPFTGETTVSAPVVNEPAPQAAPAPAPAAAPVAETPVPQAAPVAPVPAEAAPAGELFPFNPPASRPASAYVTPVGHEETAAKAELNILPTVEPKRPAVSWEANSPDAAQPSRRDDRGTFRTERNRREGGDSREAREARPFEPREPRRDERKFEPRTNQPYQPRDPRDERPDRAPRAESPAPEKKSGGFFGWLKGLFGGGKSTEKPATGGGDRRQDRDGEYGGRRRHRGGRGRNRGGFQGSDRGGQPFQHRDPRDEVDSPRQGGDQHHDEPRGEHHGEQRDGYQGGGGGRRRRRGGRGRFRGEGGDRGGPRSEGQAGGGAI